MCLNGSEEASWDAPVLEIHWFFSFPRVMLDDLIHPVTSKICFWPRTLRVGPALLHTVQRVAPCHVPPASCMHSVHSWSPPLLQSRAAHTAHTAFQVRNRDTPSRPHIHRLSQLCPFYSNPPRASSWPPAELDPIFPTNPSSTHQQGEESKGKSHLASPLPKTLQWLPPPSG